MKILRCKALLLAGAMSLSAAAAQAAEKVTFVLDWFPAAYIGFVHVGKEKGFFAEEGLDVAIELGRGGADALARVAAGHAQFTASSMGSILNAAVGSEVPAKVVMSVYTKAPDAIITYEGSGINSIADLKGKTLATGTYSGSNAAWPVIAKRNGISADDVKLQKMDFNALGPMLATGKVDAIIGWVTTRPINGKLLKEAGKEIKILPWSDFGLSGYNWSLIASDKVIAEKPEVVSKFTRAFLKSMKYFIANPEQAGKDMVVAAPDTKVDINTAEIAAMRPLIDNEITARDGYGKLTPELVRAAWEMIAESQGYASDKLDPERVINRSFVPE
ncbi:ABC transporter substrate-binding protein [Azospirillum sp. ST 5-10]|uniref:ABC transporter substrate-binding protein n=1 Tax=unclassified Azospirillum TaxID=2630922 RepID=UPI003F4A0B2B